MFQGFKLWLANLFRSAANKLDPLPQMDRPMSRNVSGKSRGGKGEE